MKIAKVFHPHNCTKNNKLTSLKHNPSRPNYEWLSLPKNTGKMNGL